MIAESVRDREGEEGVRERGDGESKRERMIGTRQEAEGSGRHRGRSPTRKKV